MHAFGSQNPGFRTVLRLLISRARRNRLVALTYCGREFSLDCFPDAPQLGGKLVEEIGLDLVERAFAQCCREPFAGDVLAGPVGGADLRHGCCREARVRWPSAPIRHMREERATDRVPHPALQ